MERKRLETAPLLDKLSERTEYSGFHMPGHQRGQGLWGPFKELWQEAGLKLDLTELPGLDNLAAAQGCLLESQKRMAEIFGAKETFYSVNGATCGLQAGLLALNRKSGKVLLPLNAHMSLYHGLILTGGRLVLMPVEIDKTWGITLGVSPQLFTEEKMAALEEVEVLVTVSPSYYGVAADLRQTRSWLTKQGQAAWLVDEAHGPHFPFIFKDKSALTYKADIVVHSTHKMMNSFTQTALMHCSRKELAREAKQALNMLQSSSPSYLLMSSLDALQAQMQESGSELWQRTSALAGYLSEEIRKIGAYRLWQDELTGWWIDPCKIVISAEPLGLDGLQMADILREKYQIDVELCTKGYVLLLVTMGHQEKDCLHLLSALKKIKEEFAGHKAKERILGGDNIDLIDQLVETAMTPRELYYREHKLVKIEESANQVAAQAVVPYPPGVPLIYPGMVITKEQVEIITDLLKKGGSVVGVTEPQKEPKLLVCK